MIDRLNRWLGENLCWLYLVAVIVTAYEVVMRYLFNAPTDWAFELTILLCAVCYLLAGGWVTQKDAHIAITSLPQLAPPRVRHGLKLFAAIVGACAMVGLAWSAWRPGLRALAIVERTGSAWNSPAPAIIKPLIFVAAVLVFLQLLVNISRLVRAGPGD
ncbi:MAG: TRAP transporter small permease [Geminicoccaceae bacterium]|nr:TRAP transporter small permease [Geminicoccaceae bacterium]MDW8124755.1 TRAP transporter small permease [Geminicoccaceae bacterium]MDW8341422.1 TRAP transporter small permease [Geminicoccaceae bacterium]